MGVVAGIFFLSEYWVYMSIYFTHYFLDQEKESFRFRLWLAKSFNQWNTESENRSKPVQGGRPVSWFRNGIFWKYARDYFPIMCVKEPKKYLRKSDSGTTSTSLKNGKNFVEGRKLWIEPKRKLFTGISSAWSALAFGHLHFWCQFGWLSWYIPWHEFIFMHTSGLVPGAIFSWNAYG